MKKFMELGKTLSKKEMKQVTGGCCAHGNGCSDVQTCVCGLTKAQAQKMADQIAIDEGQGYWCCASC